MKKSVTSVRWNIVALLTAFSFVSYLERMNISVAAKFIIPAFSLTQIQMGQVFSSFMLGYAIFQVPAGYLGDRYGPRLILTVAALTWAITTFLTGLLPGAIVGGTFGALMTLLVLRFLLGIGEAATYPVAARAIANWIPAPERAFSNATVVAGLSMGSAVTPPLISWLMVNVGWRASFYIASALALVIAICWLQYATDDPRKHPRISERELSLILSDQPGLDSTMAKSTSWIKLLRDRNLLLISLSYFFDGYVVFIFVFWLYMYLVDVRGFSILSGGVFASLPFIVSSVLTPTGGALCDLLSARVGRRWGCRAIAITGFSLSSIFLFLGAELRNPYTAIASLALSVGFVQFTEGAFWSAAIDVSGAHAGAATGVMNMFGNLGGLASTTLVPIFVKHFGWLFALGCGSALAIIGGLLWLGIQADRPLEFVAEKKIFVEDILIVKQLITPTHSRPFSAPISHGILLGDTLYMSGSIGLDLTNGNLVPGGFEAELRQSLSNIDVVLKTAEMSFSDVISVTAYLVDLNDYARFNEIYREYFRTVPFPVRTTVVVKALALDARLELTITAARGASA